MLKGKRVLLTEDENHLQEITRKVRSKGAQTLHLPMIKLKELEELEDLHLAFNQFEKYDWLVFTSPNAVTFFFKVAEEVGLKFYFYPDLKIATVGDKTKLTLEQIGFRTNFVPIKEDAFVLARDMDLHIEGKNVLIPKSLKEDDEFAIAFINQKAVVHSIPVYDEILVSYSADRFLSQMQENIDYIIFTSEEAVKSFVSNRRNSNYQFQNEKLVYQNSTIAELAASLGLNVDIIAEPQNVDGIVNQLNKK